MANNTSFRSILDKYRKIAFSERDKGDRFERLMQAYLQTDPTYCYKFKHVWLWNEFHGKNDLGGHDTGIDLDQAPVDWKKLDNGITGETSRTTKKELRQHQKEALDKTHEHFKTADRGKLIMACGTGKTFNALRIAENETNSHGLILFLVPSISLLGQTLREWSADAKEPINAICICSDPEIWASEIEV
jgi:predicted helicase